MRQFYDSCRVSFFFALQFFMSQFCLRCIFCVAVFLCSSFVCLYCSFSPTAFRLGVPISLPRLESTVRMSFGEVILGSMSYIGRREFFTFHYTFLLELSFTATAKSTEVV